MKNPFSFFDMAFVLSDPITKRKESSQEELSRVGIYGATYNYAESNPSLNMNNMRRNPGIEFAVNMGHMKNVVHAIEAGAKRPVFFEDDIRFTTGAEEHLTFALSELPVGWAVLYLGGHPRKPVRRVGDYLVRVREFSMAEAYAINGKWLGAFFEFWCNRISQPNAMYDFILGEFAAATGEGYCVNPIITYQPDGWSYIGNKTDKKGHLIEKGWANNLGEYQ